MGRPGGFSTLGLSQAAFLQIQEASGLGARESVPLPATLDHLAGCNLGTEPAAGFRALSLSQLRSWEHTHGFVPPSSLSDSCLSTMHGPCSALRADTSRGAGD